MAYIGKVTDTAGNTHLVGSTLYGTCDTAASTAAKVVTCSNFSKLETGVTIHVKFSNANTAAGTTSLNVNGTGAKQTTPANARWYGGSVVSFTYDGSNWIQNDHYWVDNNNMVEQSAYSSINYNLPILLKRIPGSSTETDVVKFSTAFTANPSTGNMTATTFNGYVLGDPMADEAEDGIPTSAAVAAYVASAVTGASQYKGAITAESSLLNTALTKGWYYIVAMPDAQTSSITIGGKTCEAGDMVWIRDSGTYTTSAGLGDHIDIIQSNIDTLTNPEITTIWNNAVPVS